MKLIWTKRLAIATPFAVLISVFTAGGGHGTAIPLKLLYPAFFLFDVFDSGGGFLIWLLLLSQFVAYGFIIDIPPRPLGKTITFLIVAAAHVALVVLSFNI